jgi:hypothetical protein
MGKTDKSLGRLQGGHADSLEVAVEDTDTLFS